MRGLLFVWLILLCSHVAIAQKTVTATYDNAQKTDGETPSLVFKTDNTDERFREMWFEKGNNKKVLSEFWNPKQTDMSAGAHAVTRYYIVSKNVGRKYRLTYMTKKTKSSNGVVIDKNFILNFETL